jgi:hypothetical protein
VSLYSEDRLRISILGLLFLLAASAPLTGPAQSYGLGGLFESKLTSISSSKPLPASAAMAAYRRSFLGFEANLGQVTDERVKFISRGSGYRLHLTSEGALVFMDSASGRTGPGSGDRFVRMRLVGANPAPELESLNEMLGRTNYFVGRDRDAWVTGVRRYETVRYRNVYPGIDLLFHRRQGALEYDFVVSPGADPAAIAIQFSGVGTIKISSDGEIVLDLPEGRLVQRRPVIYQNRGGRRTEVAGGFELDDERRVRFRVGEYDPRRPLTIDPVLVFSTYLGDGGDDIGCGIVLDAAGNLYLTGWTDSVDFPTTAGAYGTAPRGNTDAFVAKLSPEGDRLIYSTFIGGAEEEFEVVGISLDSGANVLITGSTKSTDYPTTAGAFQETHAGGEVDAFVTKLDASGSSLVYSTLLGGDGLEGGQFIALDDAANAYLTGFTGSRNFPTTPGAFQELYAGGAEAFVAKLSPDGSTLVFSTYLGGSGDEMPTPGLAVDPTGSTYVIGTTSSADFPVTHVAFQTALAGNRDAFVTKLDPSGATLSYSTFLGGSGEEEGRSVALDSSGQAYVVGITMSTDFPTTAGAFQTTAVGLGDIFVAKLSGDGTSVVYSSYLGGSSLDLSRGFAVDALGNLFVTGATFSADFPTTGDAIQRSYSGGEDAFVSKVSPDASALAFSTYLGGDGNDRARNMALDPLGNIYVIGFTSSLNFPLVNPFQADFRGGANDCFFAGGCDTFIARIDNLPAVGVTLSSTLESIAGGESLPFTIELGNASLEPQTFGFTIVLRLPSGDSLSVLPPQPLMLPPQTTVEFDSSFGPLPIGAPPGTWRLNGLIVHPTPEGPRIDDVSYIEFTVTP